MGAIFFFYNYLFLFNFLRKKVINFKWSYIMIAQTLAHNKPIGISLLGLRIPSEPTHRKISSSPLPRWSAAASQPWRRASELPPFSVRSSSSPHARRLSEHRSPVEWKGVAFRWNLAGKWPWKAVKLLASFYFITFYIAFNPKSLLFFYGMMCDGSFCFWGGEIAKYDVK